MAPRRALRLRPPQLRFRALDLPAAVLQVRARRPRSSCCSLQVVVLLPLLLMPRECPCGAERRMLARKELTCPEVALNCEVLALPEREGRKHPLAWAFQDVWPMTLWMPAQVVLQEVAEGSLSAVLIAAVHRAFSLSALLHPHPAWGTAMRALMPA